MRTFRNTVSISLLIALASTSFIACSDGDNGDELGSDGGAAGDSGDDNADAGGAGGDSAEPVASESMYAMAVIVSGPDNSSTTYVSVFDSLDIEEVDLKQAYEFGGQADIAVYNGQLYVSDGERPEITRFSVNKDGKLEEGKTISFAKLGLEGAGLRANTFINSHKSYLLGDDGQHVIWDPSTLKITGTVDISEDMTRDGMILDGSSAITRGNRLYRAFYWEDWSTYTFSKEQYIATFDTENDTFVSLESEERCPNLGALAQMDEDGTIYFSNWFYNIPGTLMKDAPVSCAVRILDGTDRADSDWKLTFNELTGGHEGGQLSYVGGGYAVFAAVHEEDITITDEIAPWEITGSENWETWRVELSTQKASAVAGIKRMAADQTIFELSGRTFLLAPNEDYSKSTAYEITKDGKGHVAFTAGGYSRGFVQIR